MRKIIAVVAAVAPLALCGATYADGLLPSKKTYQSRDEVPMEAPMPAWTGFYVGGTIGGMNVSSTAVDVNEEYTYGSAAISDSAFTYGVQIGYNHQIGMAVFGVEADFNGSTFNRKISTDVDDPYYYKASWDMYSTVRGRIGIATGNVMSYVTAGVAFVEAKHNLYLEGSDSIKLRDTQVGFVAGAGVEFAVSRNWSIKGEYLYIGLATDSARDLSDNVGQFSSDAHIARVGLNYRFNGGGDYIPLK